MKLKSYLKKAGIGLATIAIVIAGAAAFSAFEAHVINVTATIENALTVDTSFIEFGTVFPQEQLEVPVTIGLSDSFVEEDRVDDVEYFLRQKPKCAITSQNGTVADLSVGQDGSHAYTGTGHVVIGDDPTTPDVEETSYIDCGEPPRELNEGETWGVLPDLCPYISKHSELLRPGDEQTPPVYEDGILPSFHTPWTIDGDQIIWNDVLGRLAKSAQDFFDIWTIDLSVPCFGGYCAQDWDDFVHGINPQANPDDYTQPISNEHKVFGCDLWVEVSGVSLAGNGLCSEQLDLALVLDRSGSIDDTEMDTLQAAASAFITALNVSPTGPHAAQVSFSTTASLDVPLTDDEPTLLAAIAALVPGGLTNIQEALDTAQAELEGPNDREPDATSPDFIVLITDGQPTAGGDAVAAATAAKAAGTTIYVVGIGDGVDAAFLTSLASSPAHYFDAAQFSDLEQILIDLADCPENPI